MTLFNDLKKSIDTDKLFTTAQHFVPQQKLSELAGGLASSRNPLIKKAFVHSFTKVYGITLDEYARKNLNDYQSFNDFFTRELEDNARPIDDTESSIVCPADGTISQIGQIQRGQLLQAKGKTFDVGGLLASPIHKADHKNHTNEAVYYEDGSFATVYLAPSNYHRVHMPFAGTLVETRYVPGELFSVNDVTAQNVPDLFARNERLVCMFNTPHGNCAVVMVGAMIVAGIETVATGKISRTDIIQTQTHNLRLEKGEELGRFYLGSTAIVVMPKSAGVAWQAGLEHGSVVQMGELIGNVNA